MGGGSKKQKVGNKYFFGVVTVPVREHDFVSAIELSDKRAWTGSVKSGEIRVNKPKLFGGDEREGGFQGRVDVQDGALDQPINSYLVNAKETLTGAMRGCVSFVWKKPYWGANTARLPKLRTRHTNVKGIHKGWEVGTAIIDPKITSINNAFYIILDGDRLGNLTAFSTHKAGLAAWVRNMKGSGTNSFYVIFPQSDVLGGTETTQRLRISTDDEYESLAVWIEGRVRNNVNEWVNNLDLSDAAAFFAAHDNEIISGNIFIQAILAQFKPETETEESRRYIIVSNNSMRGDFYVGAFNSAFAGLNITQTLVIGGAIDDSGSILDEREFLPLLDGQSGVTDPEDVLWVTGNPSFTLGVEGDKAAMVSFLNEPFLGWVDINPAHAIRCLWTDPMRGGTVDVSEIGDSFAIEAARYFEENLGVSCKWRGLDQADTDRVEIERHIDAISFRDNETGKIELVSIRDNYDIESLEVFDNSLVKDWSGLTRPRKSEIPNQLTVTYTRRDGKSGSVTRTNIVGVRRLGRVVKASKVSYPWFTTEALAIRACLRDLRSVASDVLSGTIPISYLPAGIKPGSAIVLNNPTLGIDNVVMRVTETLIGDYDNSAAVLTVIEDKYATTQPIVREEIDYDQLRSALDVEPRLVLEASYYQLVLAAGQSMVDDELDLEPDLGRLFVTGAPANDEQLDARVATTTSGGVEWEDKGPVDFEPFGTLINSLSSNPEDNEFLVESNNTLEEIFEGDLARIDDEIIRIDGIVDQLDGTFLVTCGRGCLDGPPKLHAPGSRFVVTSVVEPMIEDYIAGQTIDVKLLSRTGTNEQTLGEATTETVTFTSRAFRPYPVGRFQIDGGYSVVGGLTEVTGTWAHRDRTLQTTPIVDDHLAANIGPEVGVFYTPFFKYYSGHDDFFAPDDFFTRLDFFAEDEATSVRLFEGVLSPSDALTYIYTVDEPDFFDYADVFAQSDWFLNCFGGSVFVGAGVRTSRGSPAIDNFKEIDIRFLPPAPPSVELILKEVDAVIVDPTPQILADKTVTTTRAGTPTSTTVTDLEIGDVIVVSCAADSGAPNPTSGSDPLLFGFTRYLSSAADVDYYLYAKVATSTSETVPIIGNSNASFTTANIIYVVRGADGLPTLTGPSGNIAGGTAPGHPTTTTVDDSLVVTTAASDDNGSPFSTYPTAENNVTQSVGASGIGFGRITLAMCSINQGTAGAVSWPGSWVHPVTSEPIQTHSLTFAPAS